MNDCTIELADWRFMSSPSYEYPQMKWPYRLTRNIGGKWIKFGRLAICEQSAISIFAKYPLNLKNLINTSPLKHLCTMMTWMRTASPGRWLYTHVHMYPGPIVEASDLNANMSPPPLPFLKWTWLLHHPVDTKSLAMMHNSSLCQLHISITNFIVPPCSY